MLVTGGTSGIGLATATLFRDSGADVTVTGTRPSASDYDADLSGMGYRQLVLNDHQSIDALAAEILQLDVLINNGGANFPNGLDEPKPDGFHLSVAMNLSGRTGSCSACAKSWRRPTCPGCERSGSGVDVGVARRSPRPRLSAAKAGIVNITRNLAVKLARSGIVSTPWRGTIDTRMTAPAKSVPELIDAEIAHIPAGPAGHGR